MSLDDYNKIKVVGKGSYGEVWLVKARKDKKQVRFQIEMYAGKFTILLKFCLTSAAII